MYTNIGVGTTFEVCNHTGMPIAAAGRVLQVISGAKPISSISLQQNILRKSLIQNLGYSTYE
ncbi:MAG: hypothetical protein H6767_01775 [Candidatus Peribacteria bacterium]|nr:MAG: hypothetical protein H6767_01775 [Candidatus Peribacteria bacterium]